MAVAAEEWEGVLHAEGGDPEVVGGDWLALAFEFENDLGVMLGGGLVDVDHRAVPKKTGEPVFVAGPLSRLCDAVAILAQHDYWNCHLFGASEDGEDGGIGVRCGGEGVGVNDHAGIELSGRSRLMRRFEATGLLLLPDFPIDLFKGFFHPFVDLKAFFVEGFGLAEVFHPRSFVRGRFQLVLDGLGDELTQRDTTLGRHGLGPSEEEVGNFQRRFHVPIIPYLWEESLLRVAATAARQGGTRAQNPHPCRETMGVRSEFIVCGKDRAPDSVF